MSSYKEIQAKILERQKIADEEIAALKQQAASLKAAEIQGAVQKILAIIEEYELTPADIFPQGRAKKLISKPEAKTKKVPPQFKDPESGATWSGRGLAPKWIKGKDYAAFKIAQ